MTKPNSPELKPAGKPVETSRDVLKNIIAELA